MQIITNGFKGIDQRIRLPRLTLLVGPNGSGKSSISDAIRFTVLGHVPILGKRPGDTAALLRGEKMTTEIVFDNGTAIRRELFRTGDALKTRSQTSWLESKSVREHDAEILNLFGSEEIDVSECLDIRELLAATASKRADRIERLLSAEMSSPDEKALRIGELVLRRLTDKVDADLPDWRALKNIVEAKEQRVLEEEAAALKAQIIDNGIAKSITWANREKREAKLELKKKKEAREELKTRLSALPEVDEKVAKEHADERDKLNREIGSAQERISHLESWEAERSVIEEELAKAEKAVEAAKEKREEFEREHKGFSAVNTGAEIMKLGACVDGLALPKPADSSELAILNDQLADLKLEEVPDLDLIGTNPKLVSDLADLRAKRDQKKAGTLSIPSAEEEIAAVTIAESEVERLVETPWSQVSDIAATLEGIAEKGPGSEWKKVRAQVNKLAKLANDNVGDVTGAQETLKEKKARLRAKKQEIATVEKQNAALFEKAEAIEKEIAFVEQAIREDESAVTEKNDKLRAEHQEAIDSRQERIDEKQKEVDDLREKLKKKDDKERAKWKEKRDALVEKRTRLRVKLTDYEENEERTRLLLGGATETLAEVKADVEAHLKSKPEAAPDQDALLKRLATLEESLDRMERTLATRDELQRLVDNITKLEGRSTVFTAFEWALQRGREEELQAAGGPLVREMTRFFEPTDRKETPYFRSETGVCEIGWTTPDGLDVPIQALSGGEWVLFAAALTAAVINLRKGKIRILLVEAAETDEHNLGALLDGIAAVSEEMTAAIVMTPKASPRDGWALRVAGEAEKAEATA